MLVIGMLLALLGMGVVSGGIVAAWANSEQRSGGFLETPARTFSVDTYALTSPHSDADMGVSTGLPFDVGTIRLRATSVGQDGDIFIGVAPQADVDQYLAGVNHTVLRQMTFAPFRAEYDDVAGPNEPERPDAQTWWTESVSGSGEQQLEWDIQTGNWAVVVMNADASPGVDVSLQAGARSDLLGPLAVGLLIGGGLLLLIGIMLVVAGAIGLGRSRTPPGPGQVVGAGQAPGPASAGAAGGGGAAMAAVPAGEPESRPYPARLYGELDPQLSNWMWLVKWFLVIPHIFVLVFLWIAFVFSSIIAWFAILFTGRYPESIFTFNVGVLRWSWRVAFYSYSALGTDRYPPFTLSPADYPAELEVDYPERLSRGLVLVKSWLLAIPHLLIVAAFTGGGWAWHAPSDDVTTGFVTYSYAEGRTDFVPNAGLSLLGVLVLVAAVILLFTGRYRRALFDLILGLNRWSYRVTVYTALMRDEYPPFRLDLGGTDPAAARRNEVVAPSTA